MTLRLRMPPLRRYAMPRLRHYAAGYAITLKPLLYLDAAPPLLILIYAITTTLVFPPLDYTPLALFLCRLLRRHATAARRRAAMIISPLMLLIVTYYAYYIATDASHCC